MMSNQYVTYGTIIADDILSYYMLDCANLSEDKNELVRATITEYTTDAMRAKLKRVFHEVTEYEQSSSSGIPSYSLIPASDVKTEPAFHSMNTENVEQPVANTAMYGNSYNRRGRGNYWRSQRRNNYRGRNDSYNKQWGNNSRSSARVNPIDGDGNIMTCDFCGSKYHFEKHCNDFKLHMSSNTYASSGSQNSSNYI